MQQYSRSLLIDSTVRFCTDDASKAVSAMDMLTIGEKDLVLQTAFHSLLYTIRYVCVCVCARACVWLTRSGLAVFVLVLCRFGGYLIQEEILLVGDMLAVGCSCVPCFLSLFHLVSFFVAL